MTSEALSVVREWVDVCLPNDQYEPHKILSLVMEVTGVEADEINGNRRFPSVTKARHLYWACLRKYCGLSYPAIGYLASRHHTTIMVGVKGVPDEVVKAMGDLYEERLNQ